MREKYGEEGHNHRTRSDEHAERADGDQGRAKQGPFYGDTLHNDARGPPIKDYSTYHIYKVLNRNYLVSKDLYS